MKQFFKAIFSPFSKMRSILGQKLRALFAKKIDASAYAHLEEILYEADISPSIALELVEKLKKHLQTANPDTAISFLKEELAKFFPPVSPVHLHSPHVILIVGVNGSGKTTTVAKLAAHYQKLGKKVLIAAGDTFRMAAVEQLETWAKRIGVDIVKSQSHSDPSAIAFDALAAAKARAIDIVLIDTAGRLQTKTDLMQEIAKIHRICQKQIPDAPQETLLVLDATTGQNAIDQTRIFHQFAKLTGIVLTKLDGSAKGGIAIPIQREFQIPIRWVGLGEAKEDLIPFDVDAYLNALLK